jgi:H+/Cl- antiporter ClcA
MLLSTVIAWFAAAKTSEYVYVLILQMLQEIAPPNTYLATINYMYAVCGVLGGFVGSATLALAVALICKEFRTFENWARIVMPGTALGILLELAPNDGKLPIHIGSLLPLFLAWQVTVAAVVGFCIYPKNEVRRTAF